MTLNHRATTPAPDAASRGTQVELRPYQQRALDDYYARVAGGARRVLFVSPTGSGKSTIASEIIRRTFVRGRRALFMAHRRELIQQVYQRLLEFGLPEHEVGVFMAGDPRRRPGAHVQVASTDTLRVRAKPLADVVILDEAHRSLAKTNRDLQEYYKRAVHVGLTATPYRADGRGLGDAYDELILVASPRELIARGYLVEPRVFTVPPSSLPDLSTVRTRGGDFEAHALAEAVDRAALVGDIVQHWGTHAPGVRTIVFATSVAHSKHIAERFRAAGVRAEHIDGGTITEERDAAQQRLESGETTVLVNCSLMTEGWDKPSAKCCILARPTKSTGLYLQMAGRILRPFKGQQAIILDHAGCVMEHGLPQQDREFSLSTKPRKKSTSGAAPVRVCSTCFAVVHPATRACPSCGARLLAPRTDVQESPEQLVEITVEEMQRLEWQRLEATAALRGYRPEWALSKYKKKFGEAPPRSFRAAAERSVEEHKRTAYDAIRASENSDAWAAVRFRVETGRSAPAPSRQAQT